MSQITQDRVGFDLTSMLRPEEFEYGPALGSGPGKDNNPRGWEKIAIDQLWHNDGNDALRPEVSHGD